MGEPPETSLLLIRHLDPQFSMALMVWHNIIGFTLSSVISLKKKYLKDMSILDLKLKFRFVLTFV
jgi:hypothetical protein